jgi:toxin ParE1/3/4
VKVIISARAERDLQDIGDWISQDSNERAGSFVRELRRACEALADMPRAFPIVSRRLRMHRKPYRSYLIFYRVGRDRIEIAHIIHAARDYGKIINPE